MTGGGYRLLASGKLWRARSRLYQRRFLQQNIHFAVFFEIYKNCNPLHRSKLKNQKIRQYFLAIFLRFLLFLNEILRFFVDFVDFHADFDRNFTNYRRILKLSDICGVL